MKSTIELMLIGILETAFDIESDKINSRINILTDLGIDSVDFLDITFDLEKELKIVIPITDWMENVNMGAVELAHYFQWNNFITHVEKLVVTKAGVEA